MHKTRPETLEQIKKNGFRAYPHEVRDLIEEVVMLREIHAGTRPPSDYHGLMVNVQLTGKDVAEAVWETPSDGLRKLPSGKGAYIKFAPMGHGPMFCYVHRIA